MWSNVESRDISNTSVKNHLKKLFVVNGYDAVKVGIKLFECCREIVQNYAHLNKVIKIYCSFTWKFKQYNLYFRGHVN